MSISQNFPSTRPSLNLNFSRSQKLDPRITFTRTSSATRVNSDGLIEVVPANSPRFDFDPISGECLGLLVEEQRSNFLCNTLSGRLVTISEGSIIGPDGNLMNKLVAPNGTTNFGYVGGILGGESFSISSGQTIDYSFSGWFAAGTSGITIEPRIIIDFRSDELGTNVIYAELQINTSNWTVRAKSLQSGISEVAAPSITQWSSNVYRVTWTVRYTQGATTRSFCASEVQQRDISGQGIFSGDGVGHFHYYGIQTERGSFPTSYIPTTNTPVTRTADNVRITGTNFSDFYNPSGGTLITNVNLPVRIPTGARSFALDDGTTAYMIDITNTVDTITLEGLENSSYVSIRTISNSTSKIIKQATAFNNSNQTISVNGGVTLPATTNLSIDRYKNLRIGGQVNNAAYLNGYIQQLVYYPTTLPSNQLITLTK